MEYRPLGRTGVQVSKLCLGTMVSGASVSTPPTPATASRSSTPPCGGARDGSS
jgi:aryl-alcohol dehydrogenase-like predicted oxidoreductase